MKVKLLSTLSILLLCVAGKSQSTEPRVLNTTGGSFKNGYYIIDWNVGELALINQMTTTNGQYIITNGFIQPFTHDPAKVDNNSPFAKDEVIILPNPTVDVLEINFRTHQMGKVKFNLYDAKGVLVYKKEFTSYGYGSIEKISMGNLPGGAYMLHIHLDAFPGYQGKFGTYKIIKL